MKAIKDFLDTLNKAVAVAEGANAAEERAKSAQQAAARALNNAEQARIAADNIKAEAKEFARRRMVEQDTIDANLKAARDAEKSQHERWIENAKGQVNTASETLTALQTEIRLAKQDRANIQAELGKLRAAFADSAAKL